MSVVRSFLRLVARIPAPVRLALGLTVIAIGCLLVILAAVQALMAPTLAGRLWTVVLPGLSVLAGARVASSAIDDLDDKASRARRQPPPWR